MGSVNRFISDARISTTFTIRGGSLSWRFFTEPSAQLPARPDGWPCWLVGSHRLSGLFVLCCVLFAPSPLGDNSHSAASSSPGQTPQRFISSGPSVVYYWCSDRPYFLHSDGYTHTSLFPYLFPSFDQFGFFLWQDHRCIHLCTLMCYLCMCSSSKNKTEPGQIPYSVTTCRKQSDRKLPWKIARSEWLNSKWGPWPGHTYAPVSECASTWMGKWPTEWMALSLMVTR